MHTSKVKNHGNPKKLTLNPDTWNNKFSQENNQIESQQNSVEVKDSSEISPTRDFQTDEQKQHVILMGVKDSSEISPTRDFQTDEQKQHVILMGGPTIQKLPEIVNKDITSPKILNVTEHKIFLRL